MMEKKVVLAYSGGLDTSVALGWLRQEYGCEVHCLIIDLGQDEDLDAIRLRALRNGASSVEIDDAREAFVHDFIFQMLQGHPLYEGQYLLGSAISRPVIAKRLMDFARHRGAEAIAHGATGKGNDQFRFEWSLAALGCALPVIAPWRIWPFRSRGDLVEYATRRGIELEDYSTNERPLSTDRNLVHTSYEGELLEDPGMIAPTRLFNRVSNLADAPDAPDTISIVFAKGYPTHINGANLTPAALIERLNKIGARHGVGRVDHVESRMLGMKSRNVYETPGLTILYSAHRAIEAMCLDREVIQLKESLMPRFARLIYDGLWFAPEMKMYIAAYEAVRDNVNGTIDLEICKGNIIILRRQSSDAIYDVRLSSLEADPFFHHEYATGYINLGSIRLRARPDGSSRADERPRRQDARTLD